MSIAPIDVLVWTYVGVFSLTAIGTIVAVFLPSVLRIEKRHVDKLFVVLMLEIVAGSIAVGTRELKQALVNTLTIAEKAEAAGRQFGIEPWTRIIRVDRSRPDLAKLKRYVENPTEAKRLFTDIPHTDHLPITFASSKTTTDELHEIRVLNGLDAWIGIVLIDNDGTIFTRTSDKALIVPESYRLLPGVVFVWPSNDISNDVITRNPERAVVFIHKGES